MRWKTCASVQQENEIVLAAGQRSQEEQANTKNGQEAMIQVKETQVKWPREDQW